ncbi:DUF2461 domain-containing protein [Hoeflea prorocentri]|uniref:DUF2461 domain-containing protein n=1 Tax=Hoeflea prorocentri TaxID=1922333 RepID=A0A9X3ZGU7_9HYPH|nr:DUF2461 domain-containing protein [Hoeflea prorocentri]MCY6380263.1 DUF2461 domain-containing protein [Hoeflea prorocentri]MDA5398063.1 DUF2461 domain-containing protein [Hoeflea prorocentri]
MFEGFPKKSVRFLQDLNKNNSREWFEAHRADYDAYFVEPAMQLIEALSPVAASLDPPHHAVPKVNKSLRRIHRDTRFSKDKTPYHTHMHIVLWTGDHPNRSAGTHLVLSHDHFGFGAGHWAFSSEGLERYRSAVQDSKARGQLETALSEAKAIGCTPGDPELQRVPRGFEADGAIAELLRRKGLVAMTHDKPKPDKRLFGPEAVGYLNDILRALSPLNRWINRYVETA